jgi:hypothetical protein
VKAMVFLQPGHGMLKPSRIFLKCSLKGFPHLGHSILILSVGSMARLTHRTGFGSKPRCRKGRCGTRSEQSMQHRLVDPLIALGDSGLRLFGLTALRLGQHRRDQPIELALTDTAGMVGR